MCRTLSCAVLAGFNPANFVSALHASEDAPPILATGHQLPHLAAAVDDSHDPIAHADAVVVWIEPERVSAGFARVVAGGTCDIDQVLDEVDSFAAGVADIARRTATVLVASWTLRPPHRAFGMSALRPGVGPTALLLRMNLRLVERLESVRNVVVLDASRWLLDGGAEPFNARLWYMAKIPFASNVYAAAARDVKAALRGVAGEARRLIVLDLDNTLWGGLVGETGWELLRVGGHDPIGEAYVDFQRGLKALAARGALLAVASRNEETRALEALRRHPEMILRPDDFAAMRINWRDKAENIAAILAELNLGASAAVFIDDQPAERARVREALPDVYVPDWPTNPLFYPSALQQLDCFDTPALTGEDRVRSGFYRAEQERSRERVRVNSLENWLESLDLAVRVEPLMPATLPRATQLLNKTNQMNLSTRRLSEPGLQEWSASAQRRVWTFRVSDRFGESGLVGLLSVEADAGVVRIVDFVLSCRVFGRRIEDTMLHHAIDHARSIDALRLVALFIPTERNGPCREFLERSGLAQGSDGVFSWDIRQPFAAPAHVRIEQAVA
jgi:FkbH-like protein